MSALNDCREWDDLGLRAFSRRHGDEDALCRCRQRHQQRARRRGQHHGRRDGQRRILARLPGGHYIPIIGYSDDGRQVKIADPSGVGPATYWRSTINMANWMASRGYSA